ncbi:MAG TPA: hypothetical protein QGF02_03005 [Candidatus Babeliales bacterium]|nr:hypothetical protein [Candidatus Babeliales bacterium]
MTKQKQFLTIFTLIFLSTTFVAQARNCGRRRKKQQKKEVVKVVQQKTKKPQKATKKFSAKQVAEPCTYKLWIGGIECRVCAKAATVALSKIKGLQAPQYRWIENDYKKSYGTVKQLPQKLVLEPIETFLKQQKFSLHGIRGSFYGTVAQNKKGTWIFKLPKDEREFVIGNVDSPNFVLLKKKKTLLKRPLILDGTIYLDKDDPKFLIA